VVIQLLPCHPVCGIINKCEEYNHSFKNYINDFKGKKNKIKLLSNEVIV
jgi:hypothetical protein